MVLILKFYTIPLHMYGVTIFLNQKALSSKHASFFNRENMTSFLSYITATLRALFAWRGSYIIAWSGKPFISYIEKTYINILQLCVNICFGNLGLNKITSIKHALLNSSVEHILNY